MKSENITIVNKLGLHARAAAKFVTLASHFISKIEVSKGNKVVNGKSIMGIMMLAASKGTEISLIIEGEDEVKALEEIKALVANKFGEAE